MTAPDAVHLMAPGTTDPTDPTDGDFAGGAVRLASSARRRFTELDGLRGIAALVVVVFHLRSFIDTLKPNDFTYSLVHGGYLMVDLFFVLSGFVLATMMLSTRTTSDVARFTALRIRRFMPLHLTGWAVALLCVSATAALQLLGAQPAVDDPPFSGDAERPWGWLSSAFLLHGFIGPNLAGYEAAWSLSIELGCNVLLVAAIALAPSSMLKRLVGPAAMVIGAVILLTADQKGDNTLAPIGLGRGLLGLGTGMLLHQAYLAGVNRRARAEDAALPSATERRAAEERRDRWASIGALFGVIALIACVNWAEEVRNDWRFLPVMPASALLLLCLAQPSSGPLHRLLNTRSMQWLGSRSFALYALHGAVIMVVTLAAQIRGLDFDYDRVNVAVIVTVLIGSLVAADVGHRWIERSWQPQRRAKAAG